MNKQLESISIVAFIINAMISIKLLIIPRQVTAYAKNDGWISVILMGIYILFIGYIFYWLGIKNNNLTFSNICESLFGRFLGKIVLLGIAFYTLISFGLSLRIFGDGMKIYLLDNTPLLVIISVMMLACVYCIFKGIKTISILLDILLPIVLFFMAVLIILSFSNINTMNLKPVFYSGIKPIVLGTIETADPLLTVGIIGYILPYFKNFNKMKRWIFISVSISIFIYFSIVIMSILSFGGDESSHLLFPTIELSKSIRMDTKILERAESLFMAAWVPITFTTLLLSYLVSTLNLKALFNTKKDRFIILTQIPLFFIVALYPKNISEVFRFLSWNKKVGLIIIFIIVPLAIIAQLIKDRRVKAK